MSPIYREIVDRIIAGARANLAMHGRLAAMGFVGKLGNPNILTIPLPFRNEDEKIEAIAHLRAVVRIEAADWVAMIHEAWMLDERYASQYDALLEKHGRVSACPQAIEVVSITFETPRGVWVATPKLRDCPPSKKRRTFDEPQWRFFGETAGMFAGILR